jgi:hypothetical protein
VSDRLTRRHLALLGVAVVVGLLLRLHSYTGLIVSDDLTHAWAATHFWDDPIEHAMPDGPGSAYTVNARRIGVNLPLWVAAAIAGPAESSFAAVPLVFSLLGVLAIAAWAGALAGPRAAVIAGFLWAVVPVDAWHATVFLQDSIYATVLAGGMAALAWAERTGRASLWLSAGLAVGYLQYVKESAAILLAVAVVAGAVRSWRARQLHRGTVWLIAGAVAVHALAILYFASATGDPWHYVASWFGRQAEVETAVQRPFPANLLRFGQYLTYDMALGIGLPIAVGFGVHWLRRAELPRSLRIQTAVVLVVQLAITIHVLRWGAWTMRYLLQVVPALIVIGAAGLAVARPAAATRVRTALVAAAIALTAVGVVLGRPQHGRFRSELARGALAVIERDVSSEVPVYVVGTERPAHYTDRAFALLTGYRPRPGGWLVTRDPASVTRGVLVWATYERHPAPPTTAPGRLLYAGRTRGGRDWIEVYAVGF